MAIYSGGQRIIATNESYERALYTENKSYDREPTNNSCEQKLRTRATVMRATNKSYERALRTRATNWCYERQLRTNGVKSLKPRLQADVTSASYEPTLQAHRYEPTSRTASLQANVTSQLDELTLRADVQRANVRGAPGYKPTLRANVTSQR